MPRTEPERIPRPLLLGAGGLVLTTLIGVTILRLAGVEPVGQPPAIAEATARYALALEPIEGGGTRVYDPESGAVTSELAHGKDGFVRGIVRALSYRRGLAGVPKDAPVELLVFDAGKLALIDPLTGWRADLRGFGSDNLATFALLMSDIRDRQEDAL
ncbi:MAG: photosynthetic complex assembly protein PuhC [Pseudomonadota bacterium]